MVKVRGLHNLSGQAKVSRKNVIASCGPNDVPGKADTDDFHLAVGDQTVLFLAVINAETRGSVDFLCPRQMERWNSQGTERVPDGNKALVSDDDR